MRTLPHLVQRVDFKHNAQVQIYKDIKNLTPEGEIEYFRRKVEKGAFGKLWEGLHGAPVIASGRDKR